MWHLVGFYSSVTDTVTSSESAESIRYLQISLFFIKFHFNTTFLPTAIPSSCFMIQNFVSHIRLHIQDFFFIYHKILLREEYKQRSSYYELFSTLYFLPVRSKCSPKRVCLQRLSSEEGFSISQVFLGHKRDRKSLKI